MKNIILYILLFALCPLLLVAQAPDTLWTKTYGGDSIEVGNSVQQTLDGGYIIAGHTKSFGAGGFDVWLLKTDSLGDTLWTRTYGGVYDDYGYAIEQTTDSGYICAGASRSFSTTLSGQIYIIKVDSNGDTLWTRTYYDSTRANAIQQTSDGGYIISYNRTVLDWPHSEGYMMKIDSQGNEVWISSCGENCQDVQQTTDDGYIGVGGVHDSHHFWYPCVYKRDSLGQIQWDYTYFNYYLGWGRSIEQTQDEGYIILGYSDSRLLLFKTDSQGVTVWDHLYSPYAAKGHQVLETTTSGYIVVGEYYYGGVNGIDLYILRTDSLGDSLWTVTYGEAGSDIGHEIDNTNDGGYIITGQVSSSDLWLLKISEDTYVVYEQEVNLVSGFNSASTIIYGALRLPKDKNCKIFDITGRVVMPDKIKPGIYFIEIDGVITQKIIKIK